MNQYRSSNLESVRFELNFGSINQCHNCYDDSRLSFHFDENDSPLVVICNSCNWNFGRDDSTENVLCQASNFLWSSLEVEDQRFDVGNCMEDNYHLSWEGFKENLKGFVSSQPVDLDQNYFIAEEFYKELGLPIPQCFTHDVRFFLSDGDHPTSLPIGICSNCLLRGFVVPKENDDDKDDDDDIIINGGENYSVRCEENKTSNGKEPKCLYFCNFCKNNEPDCFSPILNSFREITEIKCLVCTRNHIIPRQLNSYENVRNECYTRPQIPYRKLSKVTRYDQLKPGDHIGLLRGLGYTHHAVVTQIRPDLNSIEVIEYGGNEGLGLLITKAKVRRVVIRDLFENEVEKYEYEKDTSFSPEETIERANRRLGEENYNLLTNNCEHFANWCKTGQKVSDQVGVVAKRGIQAALYALTNVPKKLLRNALTKALLAETVDDAIASFCKVCSEGQFTVFSGALTAIVETFLLYYNIRKLKEDQKSTQMDSEVYQSRLNETISESIGGAVGALCFGILFGAIPFLNIAATIVGNILGRTIGRLTARFVRQTVAVSFQNNVKRLTL